MRRDPRSWPVPGRAKGYRRSSTSGFLHGHPGTEPFPRLRRLPLGLHRWTRIVLLLRRLTLEARRHIDVADLPEDRTNEPASSEFHETMSEIMCVGPFGRNVTIARDGRVRQGQGAYQLLYLAQDYTTALYEVEAQLGTPYGYNTPNPTKSNAWACCDFKVEASRIVDLTNREVVRMLGTSFQELTGDWKGYAQRAEGAAPTQELGAALFKAGHIEGFLSLSARVTTKQALVIFPQRLLPTSSVMFEYHDGKKTQIFRLPATAGPSTSRSSHRP